MNIADLSLAQVQLFFLMFLRVSAFLVFLPVFDSSDIPVLFKAGLSLTVTICLFSITSVADIPPLAVGIDLGVKMVGEIMLGFIVGLSVKLVFVGIQIAGHLAGFQMGFAVANVMDPVTSTQASIIAQLKNYIALLIFLVIDAHHSLLRALAESFEVVRPLGFAWSPSVAGQVVRLTSNMFLVALKVGAPLMATLLLASVALGLIARAVPQMNIFIVAMPLKIFIGLLFFAFALPLVASLMGQLFNGMAADILFIGRAAR